MTTAHTPLPGLLIRGTALIAGVLLTACWSLSEGYGEPCASNSDCPSLLLQCHDVPRLEARLCLTRAPGGEGQACVDERECNEGLRCDLASSTCQGGGIGLPECGSDADCDGDLRCVDGACSASAQPPAASR